MLGGVHTDLLVTVTLLFLTQTGTQCRAEDDFSLVTLPDWRTNSEYVTKCFYNRHNNLICDWTRNQLSAFATEDVVVKMLESGPLGLEGEACLEFWYLAPFGATGSELRVLLKNSTGLVEIWSSPALPRDSWRQVFIPLTVTEAGTQVVFAAASAVTTDGQVAFNQIGVRRGSCGHQCEANTELWTDESTSCFCSAGQLSCSLSACPQGQICAPQRGGFSGTDASGTCTIHSHTDCSTFDGVLFRFVAPCTYTLAKTCSPSEDLPPFSVEVVNEQKGNSSLPTVQQVIVEMGDFRVSLMKGQTQRAVVNGIWRKLPLTLSSGTVDVNSNPAAVTLETTFGLSISYDNAGAVHVNLPPTYSNSVCGLCGNFNHLRGDDLQRPDGTDARDATDLAESWQTGPTISSCEAILVPHQCDPLEAAQYASELYCGGLHSSTGPFADCLSVLGAESYFRGCLVGMCSTHGDPAVLCEALQTYADICQEAGVALPAWRNSTFCSIQCGQNSYYNSCADGCPEVCSSLDSAGPCGSCVERCECDSGFKLSGGKCVPAEDCGCWFDGNHYERGETWMQGECAKQCQCQGNNLVQCTAMQCADNEICKVKDGVKGCFSLNATTCSVYGDPHYITFDGMAYDFQGGCTYTLTTTCGDESSIQFTVTGHNVHPPLQNHTRSKLEAVTLQVEDLIITLNQSRETYVNNVLVRLPYSTRGAFGSVSVYIKNNYIILETTFGLRMIIDGENRLFLQVDEHYKYGLCGLCGTYSEQQDDDFITPGGQNATGPFEFGDSWRVSDNNECTARPNDPTLCDYDEENDAYNKCFTLLKDAFKPCHEHIHPSIYINSCVYDYCATSGDLHTLCESLKSYAAACQVAGVELPHWQTDTACADSPTTTTRTTTTPADPTPDQTICPMNCNFEENLCGWEQLVQDSFDWTRNSGPTPSDLTGPNQDHTSGAGFYMYIEGNSVTHGDSARLLSSMCNYNGPLCLHFWYHMYGSATAMALNIYLLKGNRATKLWSTRNDQGPEWHPAYLDITVSGPFQIIVEGIRGSTVQSDVAVDDISIHFGSCSGSSPDLVIGTELPSTTAEILPSHTVCDMDCSFNSNLCSWNQMMTDAFDWTWQSGSTPTLMTGPSADHTGDGHYLYIEASSVTHGDTARLIGSECSDAGPQCLQFWYHMYGSADTMGLHVYLLQDRIADAVWRTRNNQGNMWHLAQVDLTTTGPFQIIFEGRRGSNDQSDVAIDDVSLHQGHCADLVKPTTPARTTFIPDTTEGPEPTANSSTATPPQTSTITKTTATTDYDRETTTTPTTVSPKTSKPDIPTTPQLPITSGPTTTTTTGGQATARPDPSTTEQAGFETSATTRPRPPTETQTETTVKPEPPTTVKPQTPTTAGPKPGTTNMPQPPTTPGSLPTEIQPWPPTTAGPQQTETLPQTVKPQPQTTTEQTQTETQSQSPTSALPHTPTTAGPQPPTTGPQPSTITVKPQPSTTAVTQQTETQPQTTVKPQPPTTAATPQTETQPQTTSGTQAETESQSPTSASPQTPSTAEPRPSTTARPQPPTTGPQPTTVKPQPSTTPATQQTETQPQTTTRPKPSTTTGPQPSVTVKPQPQTTAEQTQTETQSQSPTSATPQTPSTAETQSSTTARPQPPTTGPQPSTTTEQTQTETQSQSPTSALPHTPTTAEPQPQTTGPQPTTAVKPQPPTTTEPQRTETQPETVKPQPPTTGPQPTTTVKPKPTTTAAIQQTETQPQITSGTQTVTQSQSPTSALPGTPTTAETQPTETLPQTSVTPQTTAEQTQTETQSQSPTSALPHTPTTAEPRPSTTARPQPPTTGPQPTTTVKPQPSTTAATQQTETQPQTTARPQPQTTGPQPTTAVKPQPSTTAGTQQTETQPQTTARPQPPTTAGPQQTETQPQTTARPQPPTTADPQHITTVKPQSTTATPQPTTGSPQPSTTARPKPTTAIQPNATTPQPTTTATSQSTSSSRPQTPTLIPTPFCRQNSHYTTCMPACAPTCAFLNGPPGCHGNEGCVPGCVCDEGFVQKRRVCVPILQCGCVDRNGTNHQFNEEWYTDHCSQKCECKKRHNMGEIDCDDKEECDGDAICLQNGEGNFYCQSIGFNECTIKEDLEFKTFDKLKYDFEGEHSYVLVQTKNLPNNFPDVYIEGVIKRKEHDDEDSRDDSSSEEDHSSRARHDDDDDDDDDEDDESEENEEYHRLHELKIRVYSHTVEFKKKRRLVVDGKTTNCPVSPTAGLNIYKRFSRIYLKTDFGLSVEFDGHGTAEIILPRIYRRRVGGLCGNFDGSKQNDWMKPDGTRAWTVEEFGESWRV